MLQNALNTASPGPVRVTHALTDFRLCVERQTLLGAARQVMQVTPDGPEIFLGFGKVAKFRLGQHSPIDQVGDLRNLESIFAYPEECMQVAQAPFALFDIWLNHIT